LSNACAGVQAKDVLAAHRAQRQELDVAVGLKQAVQIERRRLDEVDLAGEQRVDGLQVIGHCVPFDAVDLGGPCRRPAARPAPDAACSRDFGRRQPDDPVATGRA